VPQHLLRLSEVVIGDSASGKRRVALYQRKKEDGMKSRTWMWTAAVYLFTALATPVWTAAQDNQSNNKHQKYAAAKRPGPYTGATWEDKQSPARAIDTSINDRHRDVRYRVTEIGVVPGEQYSYLPIGGSINNRGALAGFSFNLIGDFFLTALPFTWDHGILQPLPLVDGWPGAEALGLNDSGLVFGLASNVNEFGDIIQTPVLWRHGSPTNLGFPAGYSFAVPFAINNRGQVVGYAVDFDRGVLNAFVWYQGQITQLPLLPGAVGGVAEALNERGEIGGYVDFGEFPPPGTGEFHSVLWIPKARGYDVLDIGGLDGYFLSVATHINNRGEVVGLSDNAAGDTHAYLWTGGPLQDLGTLPGGGGFSEASCNNQHRQIVGESDRADGNRVISLWQNGTITDLNDLVPAGTPLLHTPGCINERGEITASTLNPDGSRQAFLLTPVH
jgi:probable HAF family extracellular repeat protein